MVSRRDFCLMLGSGVLLGGCGFADGEPGKGMQMGGAEDAPPPEFEVLIYRQPSTPVCTPGYLATRRNGQTPEIMCYSLERPWQGNAPLISSIPAGSYPAIVRYDHTDRWRMELTGVPNRTHVQIHIGNVIEDTIGCVLVGSTIDPAGCSVGGSAAAYRKLKRAFYGTESPTSTPALNLRVTFVNAS